MAVIGMRRCCYQKVRAMGKKVLCAMSLRSCRVIVVVEASLLNGGLEFVFNREREIAGLPVQCFFRADVAADQPGVVLGSDIYSSAHASRAIASGVQIDN